MAKAQKKKKISDHISVKKDDKKSKKSLNPFEIHINREKHKVLGRKLKSDRGLPGVSRLKAIKKRKHTLLQEYQVQNKSNKFVDRRIGERNGMMTEDDRKIARFTAERIKSHSKKSIFNLADNEILTHRGQSLSEIEKFDDPRSDDDNEDEGKLSSGKLNDDFVESAHFGGGVLTKTSSDGAKSHKDLIDQLIAESKKRKAEKQKIREQTLDLTEKLDSEWKDLLPIVNKSKRTDEPVIETKKTDDYDKVMRELKFEARGKPSDRLKTEEEIAKEEKEKLEILEQERVQRMKGFIKKNEQETKHRSADDLDDNFAYESDPEITLAYDFEGKSLINLKQSEDESVDKKSKGELSDEEIEEDNSQSEDNSEQENDSEDDLSDLKANNSDSEEDNNIQNEKFMNINKDEPTKEKTSVEEIERTETSYKDIDDIKADLMLRKDIMEKARKELPFTFAMPDSYESLQKLLIDQSGEYQSIIIERIIKCNHPSLAEENKDNLGKLFIYLLQHINDVSVENYSDTNICTSFQIFNSIVPHIYDLAQMNPVNTINSIIEILKEKQTEYRKRPKRFPGIEVLIFLKLVSLLFPTSDFRHQAVTPSIVFMDQMLTNCRVKTQRDIAYGLFIVTLLLEFIDLSKRFIPSALIFLTGILHMAIPKTGVQLLKISPPFKSNAILLVLMKKQRKCKDFTMNVVDFLSDDVCEEFKVKCMNTTIQLAQEFCNNWKNLSSSNEIFEQFSNLLEKLPMRKYPNDIQENINKCKEFIVDCMVNKKLNYIIREQKRPKALRLYEPNIVQIFDCKRRKIQSKEKAEREKLLHKYKQERKGALREVRRDQTFLGRLKIKQKIQSDMERKEKVKRIYAEASVQQSELNALDRKKKKKE